MAVEPFSENQERSVPLSGWLRVLCWMLTLWEPLVFAIAAAGAVNAISVRGAPVALVLLARMAGTALCFAGGRALLDRRPSGPALATAALALSGAVQLFAYATPYFPSNRMPGETPLYVTATLAYYGGWIAYLSRSKRVRAIYR